MINPFIAYCNTVWSSTYVTNLNRIYYLQKRAVRAITNSDFRAHTAPLFAKLGILYIFQVNSLYIARFMFCYHKEILPSVFHNLFLCSNQVHSYNTRSANNYLPHTCRTNLKKFTILYRGPKIWNALSSNIRTSVNSCTFKKKMMQFLLNWIVKSYTTRSLLNFNYKILEVTSIHKSDGF